MRCALLLALGCMLASCSLDTSRLLTLYDGGALDGRVRIDGDARRDGTVSLDGRASADDGSASEDADVDQ